MSRAMIGRAGTFGIVSKGRIPSSLRLDPSPQASARARRYVREVLTALGVTSLSDAAELGVSELVTNAYLHTGTTITVAVSVRSSGRVRIEVGDDSRQRPELRPADPTRTTGRGLALLSAYGSWGVTSRRGGKTVWFEPTTDVAIPRQSRPRTARRRIQIRR